MQTLKEEIEPVSLEQFQCSIPGHHALSIQLVKNITPHLCMKCALPAARCQEWEEQTPGQCMHSESPLDTLKRRFRVTSDEMSFLPPPEDAEGRLKLLSRAVKRHCVTLNSTKKKMVLDLSESRIPKVAVRRLHGINTEKPLSNSVHTVPDDDAAGSRTRRAIPDVIVLPHCNCVNCKNPELGLPCYKKPRMCDGIQCKRADELKAFSSKACCLGVYTIEAAWKCRRYQIDDVFSKVKDKDGARMNEWLASVNKAKSSCLWIEVMEGRNPYANTKRSYVKGIDERTLLHRLKTRLQDRRADKRPST